MRMGRHTQTGIALTASVAAYESGRVRKHELTRADKEDDRVRNITALNAQTGPVLAAFRANEALRELLVRFSSGSPLLEATGENEVLHSVWRLDGEEPVAALAAALDAVEALYIADGHHRSAAAARVAAE